MCYYNATGGKTSAVIVKKQLLPISKQFVVNHFILKKFFTSRKHSQHLPIFPVVGTPENSQQGQIIQGSGKLQKKKKMLELCKVAVKQTTSHLVQCLLDR